MLFLDPWSRSVPQHGPVGRSWHSFTPVSSDHIFLFGGFTTERETLSESNTQGVEKEERKIPSGPEGLSCFLSGDAWLYCVSKNEWKPYRHNHTQRPRWVRLHPLEPLCFPWASSLLRVSLLSPVSQAVAHGVFWTWRESVCVWRMCQQSVVSTQSCKTDERSTFQIPF